MSKHIDTLTNMPNRVAFDATLKETVAQGGSAALALLDIDNFLEVNSDFGHDVGDSVLQNLAGLLQETPGSSVYRLSGDEFAMLLPNVTLEQAFLQMEQLRARVAQSAERFGLPDGRAVNVTIGVAQFPRDARDARALHEAADAALYAAKEAGRNQVALPPNEEMVMKSCYYPSSSIRKLKVLGERLGRKDSQLLREALDDLFRKYDTVRG